MRTYREEREGREGKSSSLFVFLALFASFAVAQRCLSLWMIDPPPAEDRHDNLESANE